MTQPPRAEAAAWPRAEREFFISTRLDYFSATTGPQSSFRRLDTNSYAEYGLFSSSTIGAKLVYGTSWIDDAAGLRTASGFSEIEAFVQQRLWRTDRSVASVRLTAATAGNLSSGDRPELASDGADVEIRALFGRNLRLASPKVFANVEAGYRRRFGDGADQIRADFLVGMEPSANWLLLAEIFSTTSLRNESPGGADYDLIKVQPSVAWWATPRLAVQAGVSYEVGGRNVSAGRTIFIGLWSRF